MTPLDARLGATLRQRRTALGMSQDAVARKLGVTYQQVQKYEAGKSQVAFACLVEYARIFGTTVPELTASVMRDEPPEANRASLEMMKRYARLSEAQKRGVRLLVQSLAGESQP
jgi:transcriptional regulator with XRE-family HTH domain